MTQICTCGRDVTPPELTCPTCIGRTRRDLTDIVTLAALMPTEAERRGVNSEAAYLAGPASDPYTTTARRVYVARTTGALLGAMDDDDPHHPLTVLGTWEMMIRDDYGHPSHERITIASAAGYLDRMLHRLANDPEQDWALFAEEIAACRKHLEQIAHNQRLDGDVGAECFMCGNGNVEKKHGERRHIKAPHRHTGCVRGDKDGYCRDAANHRIPDDWWECLNKKCRTKYSPQDYEQRGRARYLLLASELTLADMADRFSLPYSTLRRWASKTRTQREGEAPVEHPPKIRAAYLNGEGRKMYRVQDVEKVVAEYRREVVAAATVSIEGGLAAPERVS